MLNVAIGAPGDVLRIDPSDAAGGCDTALREHTFAARSDARIVYATIAEPTAASATPSGSETSVPWAPDVDGNVRAMIVARRESILLCNGGAATAVVADWTAEGVLTIRLPDARAGSPEDGCVRSTAAGARIDPAPGVAGSLLQAVQ